VIAPHQTIEKRDIVMWMQLETINLFFFLFFSKSLYATLWNLVGCFETLENADEALHWEIFFLSPPRLAASAVHLAWYGYRMEKPISM
jgi:hypothetical protein